MSASPRRCWPRSDQRIPDTDNTDDSRTAPKPTSKRGATSRRSPR